VSSFSKLSLGRLSTAHPKLQELFSEAIKTTPIDFMVVCGYRSREDQDKAVLEGKSKTPWPTSKHNRQPSEAVDICPMVNGQLSWNKAKLRKLATHILGEAKRLGISIRWGGDFNMNGVVGDDKFIDMPHFELRKDN